MSALRTLLLAALFAIFALPAFAREQIDVFDVVIEVERSGDIIVTETLDVTVEGVNINRGIFRDLPRYYELNNERLRYDYDVLSVERDGRREPYDTDTEGNALRIIIGDEDVLLEHGPHRYVLRYRVKNQVRYFAAYDEVYWNATGNYWAFPIDRARATIVMPAGAQITQYKGYTGGAGTRGADYTYRQDGDRYIFETTRPLSSNEGLTIALGFEKGLIAPPSQADLGAVWWQRYGALAILAASLGGLFFFLYRAWTRVGRDPTKDPVFPRYEAPEGYSPAAAHYIYYRGVNGHRALIATLMNLAVKGRIEIDADKDTTTLKRKATGVSSEISVEDLALERALFSSSATKTLGKTTDTAFTSAYTSFASTLGANYGTQYFRWNVGYTIVSLAVSVLLVIFAVTQTVNWTGWHTLGVLALAALNIAFMYFMPAATEKGQSIRSEIEGLRLYMETAEKLQLNAVQVGSDAPPPMTKERYERFLPYAVALGVEAPWTKHFERMLPTEAETYNPSWSSGHFTGSRALSGVTGALVANMSSGVSSAMPQSSSSSGSGGGGSSGGGGGGGGGGGW